jgi:hypothetical protein
MKLSDQLATGLMSAAIVVVQPQIVVSQPTLDEQAIANMARDVTVL